MGLTMILIGACSEQAQEVTAEGAQAQALLRGTVNYSERTPLRLNSVIVVRLQDVSLADAPAMLLAEQEIPAKGQSVPVPFALPYDPGRIDERYTYAVRAEIRDGQGALLWTTPTHHPVLTRGAPSDNVEIMVERIAE